MAAPDSTDLGTREALRSALQSMPSIDAATRSKLCAMEDRLRQLGSLMVAYSGGVDSAFLAATAHRVLGDRMLAVLADSPSLARRDLEQARAFAARIGMPLRVVATEELDQPEYARNDANRCFHCKDELFAAMKALGAKLGFAHIAYGMNADDTRDYRPGQRAAEEQPCWRRWPRPGSPSWRSARWPKPPATRSGTARPRPASPRASNMAAP